MKIYFLGHAISYTPEERRYIGTIIPCHAKYWGLLCSDGFHGVEIIEVISMSLGYFLDTTPKLSSQPYSSLNGKLSFFFFFLISEVIESYLQ